jgi:DNA-binding response OmpR family regulator
MQLTTIVLLQSDPNVAQMLSESLGNSFHRVYVARSVDELRHETAKYHPRAIILDLEAATFRDLEALKREFQETRIICNHRVADEEMWTRTLDAGADDCWASSDTRGIVSAAAREPVASRSVAA